MPVEVVIEEPLWSEMGLEALAERAVAVTLGHLGQDELELVCLGAGDGRVAELNAAFRGKAQPTNVLSWPSETLRPQGPGHVPPAPNTPEIGDIALAHGVCSREAEAAGIALADHATHLIVHGVLHLLGYDHGTDEDADLMENTEIDILITLGIANPYV
ncbi:MAG: rRNA maturation RNase YbeY [Pseudomonadota bacterium]